jgi:hypothetical protein
MKIFQARRVVCTAVRNDDKIQVGEIYAEGFDIVLEDRCIVSSVEEYAPAVMPDQGGKTPVLCDNFVIGNASYRIVTRPWAEALPEFASRKRREDEESAHDFHRKPPGKSQ